MELSKQLLKIVSTHNSKVFYEMENYSQFTIDDIDRIENEIIEIHDGDDETSPESYLGALIYYLQNVISIIKDGADKTLYEEFLDELNQIK